MAQAQLMSFHFDNYPTFHKLCPFLLRHVLGFFLALCYATGDDVFFESCIACLPQLLVGAFYGIGGDAKQCCGESVRAFVT